MRYQVAILSRDVCFARMLEIECCFMQWSVLRTEALPSNTRAQIALLDLDDPEVPWPQSANRVIGFTSSSTLTSEGEGKRSSLILHRPFSMRLLRRELLRLLEETEEGLPLWNEDLSVPTPVLDPETGTLICGAEQISLSPKEVLLLQCLLEHRGGCVSREALSRVIGASEANKIEVYVCYLRRKLQSLPSAPGITTVRGVGYRMD